MRGALVAPSPPAFARDSATEMFRFLDDNRSGRVNRVTFSARLQTLHYAGGVRGRCGLQLERWGSDRW